MNSPQKTARIAACIFLGIFFLGMSTELFIRPGMIVPGDAAAAIAGVRQRVNYEGQAAIEFEALADEAEAESYPFALEQAQVGVRAAFESLIKDVLAKVPVSRISAKFHNGLSDLIRVAVNKMSKDTGVRTVVLSGGVWQNITLLRRTLSLLHSDGFQVYLHHQVPTNDGGLSLGQAVIAASRLRGAYNVSGSFEADS